MPLNVDVRVLYYWKSLINNPQIELTDWGAFKKTCSRIQKRIKDGKAPEGLCWAIGFPVSPGEWDMLHQFAIWLWNAGGEIINSEKKPQLDSKMASETASFLRELTQEIDLHEVKLGELENKFISGEVGMIITGGWLAERLKRKFGEQEWKTRIGMSLPPAGQGGRYTFVGGCNLAILNFAKQRGNFNQALDFLKFLCQDTQFQYSMNTGALSGLKDAIKSYISLDPSYQIFEQALELGKSYPAVPEWAIIVEKQVTLDYLYRFWRDNIIDKKPIDLVRLDLEIANQVLNDTLNSTPKGINIFYLFVMVLGLTGFFVLIIFWWIKKLLAPKTPDIPPLKTLYAITFYLKKTPKGENEREWVKNERDFLRCLLKSGNVRVEITKEDKILEEVSNKFNKDTYEDQRLFLTLIAYMTKCKNLYVSPLHLEKISMEETGKGLRDEEIPLFIFSKEIGLIKRASRSRYSQWVMDIRNAFPDDEGIKILPKSRKGFKIDITYCQIRCIVNNFSNNRG